MRRRVPSSSSSASLACGDGNPGSSVESTVTPLCGPRSPPPVGGSGGSTVICILSDAKPPAAKSRRTTLYVPACSNVCSTVRSSPLCSIYSPSPKSQYHVMGFELGFTFISNLKVDGATPCVPFEMISTVGDSGGSTVICILSDPV